MPRSFDVLFESPVSVEQVHAAFSRQDYWLARLEAFGGNTTLELLTVDAEGSVRVDMVQDLRSEVLPGMVGKFYPRDLTIRHSETWKSENCADDRRICGEINVAVSGAPGCGSGAAVVEPAQNGSRLRLDGTVEFKVPLVGGKIESFIAREFAKAIPDIQRFTATWIIEHA